ncbi:ABC transporter substrate-binding protein [Aromatoleum sp.]|uniref:ABC transporter substrate-binding protein n=1 Tax=Aromatoleum sp. TaxID=2307007 RepID=UPI002FC999A5
MRKGWLAVAVGLILVVLAGCGKPVAYPLAVGVNPWIGYDPLVLARERALVDPAQVKVVELSSSSQIVRNLHNGVLDAAALSLDEALRLAHDGAAIRIVAVLGASAGGDAVLVRPTITTLSQLKGKRIGVEQSAGGALVLARLLQAAGLSHDEVSLLRIEASLQEGALRAGWIDAVVTFEPTKSRLQAEGYRVLFDSTEMPDELIGVMVVRTAALAQRPDDVVALLAGWERGVEALLAAPAAAAGLLAPGANLDPETYLASLQGLKFETLEHSAQLLAGDPAPLAKRHHGLGRLLMQLGLIRKPPDWSALLTPEPALHALLWLEAQR